MLTAEARIQTAQPSRYLVQLCRHASSISHKILQLHPGKTQTRPEVQHVEWSDTAGTLTLSWGRCTMQAGQDTLTVRAEAANEENLQRIQSLRGQQESQATAAGRAAARHCRRQRSAT